MNYLNPLIEAAMSMNAKKDEPNPGLEVLEKPRECATCGGEIRLTEPDFCEACVSEAMEQIRRDREHARRRDNELRLKEQAVLTQLSDVRKRTRLHLSKPAPAQNTCVTCEGRGGFVTFGADSEKYDGGAECPDCNGTGVA